IILFIFGNLVIKLINFSVLYNNKQNMNFNELISGNIAVQATEGISQKLGVDKDQTKWVISAAIPLMLSSINYNAKNKPEQAASLNEAIATEESSSMFDNISSLFTKEPSENNNNM